MSRLDKFFSQVPSHGVLGFHQVFSSQQWDEHDPEHWERRLPMTTYHFYNPKTDHYSMVDTVVGDRPSDPSTVTNFGSTAGPVSAITALASAQKLHNDPDMEEDRGFRTPKVVPRSSMDFILRLNDKGLLPEARGVQKIERFSMDPERTPEQAREKFKNDLLTSSGGRFIETPQSIIMRLSPHAWSEGQQYLRQQIHASRFFR